MESSQRNIQHLHWRAGFGSPGISASGSSVKDEISSVFSNSKKIVPLVIEGWDQVLNKEFRNMNGEEKIAYRKQERQARLQINQNILSRYAYAKESLREKMTFFWMGHFACRIANPVFTVKYYNTINKYALGSFSNLLNEMIKNGALLQYLNNNQNRKSSPNENFARELMELFTLGIGNYSETDVKEAARSFTGWGFDRLGDFMFREEQHDKGTKVFLGKKGNFKGDDIAGIILRQKQSALFITKKIYRFFVNVVPDDKIISDLADHFFETGYHIESLMQKIFSSEWFYDEKNVGTRIKSPIELMAAITRDFSIKFQVEMMPLQLYKIMGQVLFDPPNVAGWPGGNSWIDSSSLLYRMRLPQLLLQNEESFISPKDEFDAQETLKIDRTTQPGKKVSTTFNSEQFISMFTNKKDNELTEQILNYLLQCPTGVNQINLMEGLVKDKPRSERALNLAIYTMSLPEYQLC